MNKDYIKKGLNTSEVNDLQKKFGKNEISRKEQKTKLQIFIEVVKDPIIMIMIVAMIISIITGASHNNFSEAVVIGLLIIVNITISFVQELKTIQKLEALNAMNEDKAIVIRNGKEEEIKAINLVPGDIVKLKLGFIARADMQLIDSNNILVDESFLTGESEDVKKEVDDLIYSNSAIKNGQGFAIVKKIGMETKIGEIAKQVDQVEETKSQLELKILHITKILLIIAVIAAFIIAVLTLATGGSITETLSITISILIATVPEGLATVLTIVLTFMSQQMANNNALVKKVALLETLGEVEYVCSDKTGTITENKMSVTNVTNILETELTMAISKKVIDEETPTSKAISQFLQKFDTSYDVQLIDSIPFNSTIKKAGFLVNDVQDNKNYVVIVGAPDFLISDIESKVPEITTYTDKGLRTLAIMFKEYDKDNLNDFDLELARDYDLISLYGIQDPPKESAIDAVKVMHNAKINTVMITGDNIQTAKSIAKQAGIIESKDDLALTGEELNNLSDTEFDKIVEQVKVYARVKPEDKFRIVSRLQAKNKIVAMTGDGTNDSIALRKANVGVAMGIAGTDISKESADLILLDDNFSTINEAIKGGRLIFDNLRKFIRQMLTSNAAHTSSIMFALIFALLLNKESNAVILPMTSILILWVNVISDAIPCLALGLDNAEKDLMDRSPIDPNLKLLSKSMMVEILIRGFGIGLLVFLTFNYCLHTLNMSEQYARTMGFIVLSFGQLIHIFDARSFKTIYRKNPFENKLIWLAVISSAILNLMIIYTPLNTVFGLEPLKLFDLLIGILISSTVTFGFSIIKLLIQAINNK